MATKSSAPSAKSGLAKANALFLLGQNPEAATERAWELYTANRQGAERFPGMKIQDKKMSNNEKDEDDEMEEDEDEDEDSDEDDMPLWGGADDMYVLKKIRSTLTKIEKEMGLKDPILQQSFRMLSCDALFEERDEVKIFLLDFSNCDSRLWQPRTVSTLTRVYSPTKPTYIDVHFTYHCRSRYYEIEWYYKLGFKIYTRPAAGDYHPDLKTFERGSFEGAHSSNGWRPIAYGFYDDTGEYGRNWKRIEQANFKLGQEDVLDIHEALWGTLEDLPDDADKSKEEKRRRELVNSVRILLAAVGIDYEVACKDNEGDDSGRVWMLEGLSDRWFARGIRRACGFQLKDDPDAEARGRQEKAEMWRGDDDEDDEDDEDYDSDGF